MFFIHRKTRTLSGKSTSFLKNYKWILKFQNPGISTIPNGRDHVHISKNKVFRETKPYPIHYSWSLEPLSNHTYLGGGETFPISLFSPTCSFRKYSWPLNNVSLNCVGPLICGFVSIKTYSIVSVWSLPYDFLNNIFSHLLYGKNTVYNRVKPRLENISYLKQFGSWPEKNVSVVDQNFRFQTWQPFLADTSA